MYVFIVSAFSDSLKFSFYHWCVYVVCEGVWMYACFTGQHKCACMLGGVVGFCIMWGHLHTSRHVLFLCVETFYVCCFGTGLCLLCGDGFTCGDGFVCCEGAVFSVFCRSGNTVSYQVIVFFVFILIIDMWGEDFLIAIKMFSIISW